MELATFASSGNFAPEIDTKRVLARARQFTDYANTKTV